MIKKIIKKINQNERLKTIFDVFDTADEKPEPQLDDIIKMIQESEPPQK
jgi:hypothetical protein